MQEALTEADFQMWLETERAKDEAHKAMVQEAVDAAAEADAIELRDGEGRMMIVTRSIDQPGAWRLTWFCQDGQPLGHTTHARKDALIETAMGIFVRGLGAPYGHRGYRVARTMIQRKDAR